jgi:dTDP-4-amino-4,6-dideoxygalactose transaminase
MLGYYAERFRLRPEDLPAARDCDHNTMAIPLHSRMSARDYERVAESLKGIS